MNAGRAARVLAALLGAVLLATGCASIPSSSPPQVFPGNPQETAAPPDPRYDAIRPREGESPQDIVKDFLAVSGSHQQQHAGARAYLTPNAAKRWDDTAGVIALEDAPIYFDQSGASVVTMRATQRGRVDNDGSYLANSAPYPYDFRLVKIDGQWRIDNPPNAVLVTVSTFERAWRPYDVFFLDSTRTRVVPDVRMLPFPQDATLPSLLVRYLGAGPSAGLQGAVVSDLDGVRLQSNIVRDNQGVGVYLSGLGRSADTLEPGGFAQLVWTLNQLGVGGIEVFLEGRPIAPRTAPRQTLQRFGDWRGYDPDALGVSTPGYFVRDGGVLTTAGQRLSGPVGSGAYAAQSVGVSLDQRSMAVVGRRAGGSVGLYVGATGATPRLALIGRSMTPPTWGSAVDEVWTVRDGREIVLAQTNGQTSRVTAPSLEGSGPIWALRLSRDGARVAIISGRADKRQLSVGVVVRTGGTVRIDGLRALDVGAGPVADVSWVTAHRVIALVRAGADDSSLYTVSIDGRTSGQLVSAVGLPAPPTAVAAAPNLPLIATASGAVWRSPGSGEPWSRVTRDAAAIDTAPAYPG